MNDHSHTDFDRFLEYGNNKVVPQILCGIFCRFFRTELNKPYFKIVTCIDIPLHTISTFEQLLVNSFLSGKRWDVVFITILLGKDNHMASAISTNKRLDDMVDLISKGDYDNFVSFDESSNYLSF